MPSVLERLGAALRATLIPQALSLKDPKLTAFFSSTAWTDSGTATVTETTALRYPAVWAAVQCIAGDVASLPFFHYKLDGDKREKFKGSRLYRVLHDEFNPEMSALIGRETMTAHVLLWGNAYAEIVRNDLGQVVALWPIEPNRVRPDRPTPTGPIVYRVSTGQGAEVPIPAERMLHVVGLGFNGLMGYSVIGMQREALSVGLATQKLGGDVMARGAKYSGFFEHPRTLGATAKKNIQESVATDLPGGYRILEEGMTYKPGSMPLRDAQFMELQKYQVTEVARIFGIPPHKLADLERATYSNIEESNIDYVIGTLRRWLVRWEQECNRKLIAPLEKQQQWTEHSVDALLRGKTLDRYTAHSTGIMGGFVKINEARRMENLDPVPGGETLITQGAMVPLAGLQEFGRAEKVDALGGLIRAGFDPAESLKVVGLPPIPHLGIPPVTVQPENPGPAFGGGGGAAPPADGADRMAALMAQFRAELLAGKLVRRELAQLRKRAADPTAAVSRLEAFYTRWLEDAKLECRGWAPKRADAATRALTAWADAAMQACVTAAARGMLGPLVQGWERDREAALARALGGGDHGAG